MKGINILSAILILLVMPSVQAQRQLLHPSPKGVIVLLGNEFAKDFTYQISRRTSTSEAYVKLDEIRAPINRNEFDASLSANGGQFKNLLPVSSIEADRYWTYFEASSDIDSLLMMDVALGYLSMGLAYLDTSALINEKYQYKIEQLKLGTTIATEETDLFDYRLPTFTVAPIFIKSNYDGKYISLRWMLREKSGLQRFNLYRRANLRGDFKRHHAPISYNSHVDSTFIIARDTLLNPFEVYEYQIAPVDLFGNEGSVTPAVQENSFSDFDFPYLQKFDARSRNNRQMDITWRFEQRPFIRSIKLMRSTVYDSGYVEIAEIPPTDTLYTDFIPVAMENYYYRLILNGPNGVSKETVATFGHYVEMDSAERVVNLRSTPLQTGVRIEWEDQSRTTYGFYVYRRPSPITDFLMISDLIPLDTSRQYVYLDTSDLEGNTTYQYVVQAVNDGYETSEHSDTLSVRPLIPTSINMPTGFRLRKEPQSCHLFWDDQGKANDDLYGYTIYRKRSDQDSFQVLEDLIPNTTNHYLDSTIAVGFGYSYMLQAKDYFGAESPLTMPQSAQWLALAPAPPNRPKIVSLDQKIILRWDEVRQKNIIGYNIYKYRPGSDPTLVTSTDANTFKYQDAAVRSDVLYFYYLTSLNDQQIESSPSQSTSTRL